MFRAYVLLLLLIAGTSQAQLLTQPPSRTGMGFSDVQVGQSIAENFVLEPGQTIGAIRWWGGYAGFSMPAEDRFEVVLYADRGGLPGAEIGRVVTIVPRSQTGAVFFAGGQAVIEHVYQLDGALFGAAGSGTRWLEITHLNTTSAQWGWEFAYVDPATALAGGAADQNGYFPVERDFALEIDSGSLFADGFEAAAP